MLFTFYTLSVFLSLAFSLVSCGAPQPTAPLPGPSYTYNFASPDLELKLPGRLKEISGLGLVNDSLVAAVQDEDGEIYIINFDTGEVVDDFKFAKDGDFEGIEFVNDTLYVLRSDGDIFIVSNWRSKHRDSKKIETYLATKNDTEGLAYQPSHNRLLVAAKEFPGRGRSRVRSIYGFDLTTRKLDPEPVYTIPLDTIGVMLGLPGEYIRNLLSPILDLEGFKPSALSVHPRTGDIFVVSSVLRVIAVLDPDGRLKELYPIDLDDLPQPEGLAFLPSGDLLISTEGQGGKGRIFRFNEQRAAE